VVDFNSRIASVAGVNVPTPTRYPVPIPRMLLSPCKVTFPSETNAAAVMIPDVLTLELVESARATEATLAVPVRFPVMLPTNPPVAVMIPDVLTLELVDSARPTEATLAVPVRFPVMLPTNPPVAVMIPDVLTLPFVVSARAT